MDHQPSPAENVQKTYVTPDDYIFKFDKPATSPKCKTPEHGYRPYECNTCHEYFGTGSQLTEHSKTHHCKTPYKCRICGKCFTFLASLERHIVMHDADVRKTQQCDLCPKKFASLSRLKNHIENHWKETNYSCMICHQYFADIGKLGKHLELHSGGHVQFVCEICNTEFASIGHLFAHRLHHNSHDDGHANNSKKSDEIERGVELEQLNSEPVKSQGGSKIVETDKNEIVMKILKCEICGKTFSQSGNLSRHRLVHSNQATYACDLCNRNFKYLTSLRRHKKVSHLQEVENR